MPPAPTVQIIALFALLVLAAGCCAYWLVVLWQVIRTATKLPTARGGLALPEAEALRTTGPPVCLVVPAHNEQAVIGDLARSLRAQDYPNLSVVFSLDRCTDDTDAVLRDAIRDDRRFTIHHVTECPPDWAGKVHAIHSAVHASPSAAAAELLLFADADTAFDPGCVRACVALLRNRKLDMLSLLSTLTTDRWFEKAVQPMAAMELIRQYPPLKVGRGPTSRPFANGQFMLFRREAYEAVGGHESAKAELLEDLFLARRVAWGDRTVGVLLADNMLRCRMYPTWAAFRRGWKRIYTEAANCRADRLRKSAVLLVLTGVLMPVGSVVATAAGILVYRAGGEPVAWWCGVAGAAGTAAWLVASTAALRLGGSPFVSTLLSPIGAMAVVGILAEAAKDLATGRATAWAGRHYVRQAR